MPPFSKSIHRTICGNVDGLLPALRSSRARETSRRCTCREEEFRLLENGGLLNALMLVVTCNRLWSVKFRKQDD
ncbi:hypothetical protein NPIL_648031 [Nephila pilipes]|uniref:Uncharacterized protein n=1 Tax=Nephila pilipes TaxID=299642 RepID=A0A8X6R046_NEPPI|nr:hypothetical protein NPIL_648031 [Nephila pilipes]